MEAFFHFFILASTYELIPTPVTPMTSVIKYYGGIIKQRGRKRLQPVI